MGDGGKSAFDLTSLVPTSSLFMYIGEVGDNGEVAAGTITVSDVPTGRVPEPLTLVLTVMAVGAVGAKVRSRIRQPRPTA